MNAINIIHRNFALITPYIYYSGAIKLNINNYLTQYMPCKDQKLTDSLAQMGGIPPRLLLFHIHIERKRETLRGSHKTASHHDKLTLNAAYVNNPRVVRNDWK